MTTVRIGRRQALAGLAGGVLASRIAEAQTPSRGGTLTVGLSNDAKTYDPIFSVQFTERYVLYLAFDTLVKYGADFSIKPELAESWETSADGKRIVFTLRQGVRFQDGTPFDAAAVKWNIDQRLDPKVNSPQRQVLAPMVVSVDVVDPQHVAFNLVAPSPALFSLLGERVGIHGVADSLAAAWFGIWQSARRHGRVCAEGMDARQPRGAGAQPGLLADRACRISIGSSCRIWRDPSLACRGCSRARSIMWTSSRRLTCCRLRSVRGLC